MKVDGNAPINEVLIEPGSIAGCLVVSQQSSVPIRLEIGTRILSAIISNPGYTVQHSTTKDELYKAALHIADAV